MTTRTIVFDLDGTLVDTAPDLIDSLNVLFAREGLTPIAIDQGRVLIGGGVKRLIERGLSLQGRTFKPADIDDLFRDYVAYYAEHIADRSRPFPAVERPPSWWATRRRTSWRPVRPVFRLSPSTSATPKYRWPPSSPTGSSAISTPSRGRFAS